MTKTQKSVDSDSIVLGASEVLENGATLIRVEYRDPFMIEDPILRQQVEHEIYNLLIPAIEKHKKDRGDAYVHAEDNHVTQALFAQSHVLDKWRASMPTAAALYPLQKPHMKKLADGTAFDEAAERYFPHALDGVGLRSRAEIMSYVMYDHFENRVSRKGKAIQWTSLACGAAIPIFDAAERLIENGAHIDIQLVDLDKRALKHAVELARSEYSIHESIVTTRMNILRLNRLKRRIGVESQDAIDILGFFEYIPAHTWKYRKHKIRYNMPGAIDFLRSAYALLKPGGVLVLGNMRDTHPQLQFTTQIVRWPYIRPRSLERVSEIISSAGIDMKDVTYYQASDNVYTVAAIVKPLEN